MKSKGFTLIELVVIIVILGILVAIAIPRYIDLSDQAKKGHDRANLAALRGATHLLYAQSALNGNAAWPADKDAVTAQLHQAPTFHGAWPTYSNGVWSADWE